MKPILYCLLAILAGCSKDPLTGDYKRSLSGGYYLVCTSSDDIRILRLDGGVSMSLGPKIVQLAWNHNVIAAKEQNISLHGSGTNQMQRFTYWILDLSHTNRLGPFNYSEFTNQLNNLGHARLTLKDIK